MADPEDVWWRLADGIPVILTGVHRGRAHWETFDGGTGACSDAEFTRGHRPIRVQS